VASKIRAKRLESDRKWRAANPDKVRAARKRFHLKNPTAKRDSAYRQNYGLTYAEVRGMWIAQERRCACCDDFLEFPAKHTHVDHCHETNTVRGVICHRCNRLLGAAETLTWPKIL
jgi:hypothetical protein